MTSCFVTASISSMRATSNVAAEPFSQMTLAASLGMIAEFGHADAACASISNQIRKRVSGLQMAVISGRE